MLNFGGVKSSIPPSCLVSIYAENSPNTVNILNYSVPLEGLLEPMDIVITRSLEKNFSSGIWGLIWIELFNVIKIGATPTVAATVAMPKNDANVGKCAQDALNAHSGDLKELLSDMSIFGDVAGACQQAKIVTFGQYQGMFDDMSHKTVSQRVDWLLNCVLSVVKHSPKQLGVFLNILIDKGNIALVEVAEKIAQSCKLSILFSLTIKINFIVNTEVPDQYHIILTES